MFKILNQAYPAPTAGLRSAVVSILFGLFVGLFLLFFEPFDFNLAVYENKTLTLLFYGVISFLVLFIFLYILPLLFPKNFSDDFWTVKHQILFYFVILLVIATLNGFYTNYIDSLEISLANYWWMITRTFALGGIPVAFLTILDYQRKLNFHFKEAQEIIKGKKIPKDELNGKTWSITTDLKNETLKIAEDTFLYAKAVGNYVDVYSIHLTDLKKETYRVSLSSLESQLKSDFLKRCHRSYLVNLKRISDVSGNAQGLKLRFTVYDCIVPVSRNYINEIKRYFAGGS